MLPPRRPIARASLLVVVAAALVALAGCSATPPAGSASTGCGGHVKEVLLGDDSATDVVAFDASESPKIFNLPAAPAPTCAYRTVTTTQGTTPRMVTHRSYLYIGISSADAQKVIAAITATAGQVSWTAEFANVPAPSSTPAPYALQTATWDYNTSGAAGTDRGSMGYAYNAPINPGIAKQVGLEGSPNVLRVETEISTPKK
jgi:hypothetical protein